MIQAFMKNGMKEGENSKQDDIMECCRKSLDRITAPFIKCQCQLGRGLFQVLRIRDYIRTYVVERKQSSNQKLNIPLEVIHAVKYCMYLHHLLVK